jgi:hypothetical protein
MVSGLFLLAVNTSRPKYTYTCLPKGRNTISISENYYSLDFNNTSSLVDKVKTTTAMFGVNYISLRGKKKYNLENLRKMKG